MAQVVALLQSDPSLLRCQLHRLDSAVDLGVKAGKAVGAGYFDNGKILLRKRPALSNPITLESMAHDVKSECFFAACHGLSAHGFREEDTEPYRFRKWLFAGTGRVVPVGERARIIEELPAFMRRGVVGPSEAELAFMVTLAQVYSANPMPEHPDLEPDVVADALRSTLAKLDAQAEQSGVAKPQTSALLSNGRVLVAMRRGRPLSYSLLEGIGECDVCGIDRTVSVSDPRVRPHRTLKGVVVASRPKANGLQWLDIPDNHLFTVSRDLAVRVMPL